MRLAIEVVTTAIWLPMELMVIATLLKGQYKRFPFILAFVAAEFLAVAAEIPTTWAYYHGIKTPQRTWVFMLNEVVLQVLIYAVVISLIYRATASLKSRRVVAVAVIVGAFAFAGGSFLIHRSAPGTSTGEWLTPWSRDLNFCSAILDLGLWTLLISARKKDSQLLLITGALGIRFTGEAIGDSIRQLATQRRMRYTSLAGAVMVTLSDMVCLYIWWRALREQHATVGDPVTNQQKNRSRDANAAPDDVIANRKRVG